MIHLATSLCRKLPTAPKSGEPNYFLTLVVALISDSLHCLGGLVVGLLAVPGILPQADYSAWV